MLNVEERMLDDNEKGDDAEAKEEEEEDEEEEEEEVHEDDAEPLAELDDEGDQPPIVQAVLGEDPNKILVSKAEGPPAVEVYQPIQENMDSNTLQLSSPFSVTSTICDGEDEYPNNQSQPKADQTSIFLTLWVIMHNYQHFVKMLAYDPPGLGNCGYYAMARAVGIFHCDAHQTVQNTLVKELKTH